MRVSESVYQFFFHPLADHHTNDTKIAATITLVALSILSGFLYLIPFAAINLCDRFNGKRVVTKPSAPVKGAERVRKIFKEKAENIEEQKSGKDNPSIITMAAEQKVKTTPVKQAKGSSIKKVSTPVPSVVATAADMQKVQVVKKRHKEQLESFEKWAKNGQWEMFHHQHSHYDWWMFPINRSSAGQGTKYTVHKAEIETLKNDPEFMRDYLRGAELVAKSWGWDIKAGAPVAMPMPAQHWEDWPVRLGKMADSLRLFGQENYRHNMKSFALQRLNVHSLEPWVLKALGF